MNVKPLVYGAVAALALTIPVLAAAVSGPRPGNSEMSGLRDLGNLHQDIQVAMLVTRSSGGQSAPSGASDTSTEPLPVAVVPLDPTPLRPKRVARVVHEVPVVVREEVAVASPAAFHPDRLWTIGSFR